MDISGHLQAPTDLSLRKNLGTHWIGGWVGLRDGLNGLEKGKSFGPAAVNICYRI